MNTLAYPLQFPLGVARTQYPKRSPFATSFAAARDNVLYQLRLMGASDVIISSNVPLRNDGLPYGRYSKISDPGVAVYFTYNSGQRVLACDKWQSVEANMHAIGLTVQAIRGMDRWGVNEMIERLFTGFAALPPPSEKRWWEVLDISENSTPDQIKKAYKKKAIDAHPDTGGSTEEFREIRQAYEKGMAAAGQQP